MTKIAEIVKAAEILPPEDFLKLRAALDMVEEKLWERELAQASTRHRKARLTDAKIDELALKRRKRSRQARRT